MLPKIEQYRAVVGDKVVDKIRQRAKRHRQRHVVHVNSSFIGGGVAELLQTLVLLFNDLGIQTGWRVVKGETGYYRVTKAIHNLLQGGTGRLQKEEWNLYHETAQSNSIMNHFTEHDLVIMHDPQPLSLIDYYRPRRQPWVWRCHLDLSAPEQKTFSKLLPYINKYEQVILSMADYQHPMIKPRQRVVMPSIDPLNNKNKKLPAKQKKNLLSKVGVPTNRPYLLQVSRFDRWKDPLGVIEIYQKVKKQQPAALVLAGELAMDDPEGPAIFDQIKRQADKDPDIHLVLGSNDQTINALQSQAAVVIQNSHREGFGLTVTESMYKETPVVTQAVGGIRLQIEDRQDGFFYENTDQAARLILDLLKDDQLKRRVGRIAKQKVIDNFLVTRQINDYLDLFDEMFS